MSKRVSKAVLLCEDEAHQRLVRAFLKRCGISNLDRLLTEKVASKLKKGGNDVWVLENFHIELQAVRQRQKAKAETLLIVVIDADKHSVVERRSELNVRAKNAEMEQLGEEEIALLIPKRNIETWFRALLGETVDEEKDYKNNQKPTKEEIRQAAEKLYEWSCPGATLGKSCAPSLAASLPIWQMIGTRLK